MYNYYEYQEGSVYDFYLRIFEDEPNYRAQASICHEPVSIQNLTVASSSFCKTYSWLYNYILYTLKGLIS